MEVVLAVTAQRELVALAVFKVIQDRTQIPIVRVLQAARRLIDVGRREELDARQVAGRVKRHVGEGMHLNRDIVIVDLRLHVLPIEVEVQVVRRVPLEVERSVLRHVAVLVDAASGADFRRIARVTRRVERALRRRPPAVAGREHRAALVIGAEAGGARRVAPPELAVACIATDGAALEIAVRVEREVGRPRSRHGNAPTEIAGPVERPLDPGADVESVKVGAEPPVAERALAPVVLVKRAQILRRGEHLAAVALPLTGSRDAVALAVIFVVEEVDRRREESQLGPVRSAILDDCGTAILDALRARLDVRIGHVGHDPEFAALGLPTVAVEAIDIGRPFLVEIAVIGARADLDQLAARVERNARAKVDGSGDAALDHVGGLVLVDVHAAEELGRDVGPAQPATAVRAERVTAVEFGADLGKAADDDARRLGREVRRVAGGSEAVDGNAGDALQRFGDRLVRECAYVGRSDRVDDGVGVPLDLLRRAQCAPLTGDDDRVLFGGARRSRLVGVGALAQRSGLVLLLLLLLLLLFRLGQRWPGLKHRCAENQCRCTTTQ